MGRAWTWERTGHFALATVTSDVPAIRRPGSGGAATHHPPRPTRLHPRPGRLGLRHASAGGARRSPAGRAGRRSLVAGRAVPGRLWTAGIRFPVGAGRNDGPLDGVRP